MTTKKPFPGFSDKAMSTPLPNLLFSHILPQIEDVAEIKVTLYLFWFLFNKKGFPRFVTYKELLSDTVLMNGMGKNTESATEALHRALDLIVERGSFIKLTLNKDKETEEMYFLNTESNRRLRESIEQGRFVLKGLVGKVEPQPRISPRRDIFSLYEQNIGIVAPMIAEELREAEKLYPKEWIENAFKEAVALNRRNWRYISRILERWATEGIDDGKPRRDIKEAEADKYIKGKYGHLVKR